MYEFENWGIKKGDFCPQPSKRQKWPNGTGVCLSDGQSVNLMGTGLNSTIAFFLFWVMRINFVDREKTRSTLQEAAATLTITTTTTH